MDEVSSYVRLVPAVRLTARPPKRLFRLVFESHDGRALGADSEEKHEPVSDIDTAVADSLKVLDLKRPIREADICRDDNHVSFGPVSDINHVSFDHIVGAQQERCRQINTDCFGSLEVDNQFELRWLLNRQVGRLCSLGDTIHKV